MKCSTVVSLCPYEILKARSKGLGRIETIVLIILYPSKINSITNYSLTMQRRKDSVLLILSMMEWLSVETQQQLSLQVLVILTPTNVTWIGKDSNLVR